MHRSLLYRIRVSCRGKHRQAQKLTEAFSSSTERLNPLIISETNCQVIFLYSHPPVFQTWNEKLVPFVPFSLVWVDTESGNYAEAF